MSRWPGSDGDLRHSFARVGPGGSTSAGGRVDQYVRLVCGDRLDQRPAARVVHRLDPIYPDRPVLFAATSATVVLWSGVVFGAWSIDRSSTAEHLPVAGLLIELVAACALGWLLAAVLINATNSRGTGTCAATGVVLAALLTVSHPRSIAWLWALPGPTWRAAYERWVVIAVVALAGLTVFNHDPAGMRRSLLRSQPSLAKWLSRLCKVELDNIDARAKTLP